MCWVAHASTCPPRVKNAASAAVSAHSHRLCMSQPICHACSRPDAPPSSQPTATFTRQPLLQPPPARGAGRGAHWLQLTLHRLLQLSVHAARHAAPQSCKESHETVGQTCTTMCMHAAHHAEEGSWASSVHRPVDQALEEEGRQTAPAGRRSLLLLFLLLLRFLLSLLLPLTLPRRAAAAPHHRHLQSEGSAGPCRLQAATARMASWRSSMAEEQRIMLLPLVLIDKA